MHMFWRVVFGVLVGGLVLEMIVDAIIKVRDSGSKSKVENTRAARMDSDLVDMEMRLNTVEKRVDSIKSDWPEPSIVEASLTDDGEGEES